MRIPDSLYSLVEHGILEEVVRPLMSGKEAQVFLVVSGGEQRVAKIYKEAQNRTFQKRSEYTEGRKVRNSRDQRAMSKGSRHGRAQNEAAWRSTEVDMIYRLRQAGVRVPVPHHFIDGVLIMELVKDAEGFPAPRLGDLVWEPEDAFRVYEQLLAEVVRMLASGVVHGDLSDFNVLMSADGPVIIDFPQAVDASSNQNARKLLLRDVDNLQRFLAKFAPERPALPYAQEMWELYRRNALTADTRLSGRYRAAAAAANTDAVMDLISDAARDERRRREQLGLSMRGAPREHPAATRGRAEGAEATRSQASGPHGRREGGAGAGGRSAERQSSTQRGGGDQRSGVGQTSDRQAGAARGQRQGGAGASHAFDRQAGASPGQRQGGAGASRTSGSAHHGQHQGDRGSVQPSDRQAAAHSRADGGQPSQRGTPATGHGAPSARSFGVRQRRDATQPMQPTHGAPATQGARTPGPYREPELKQGRLGGQGEGGRRDRASPAAYERPPHQREGAGHQREGAGHQREGAGHQREGAGHQREGAGRNERPSRHPLERSAQTYTSQAGRVSDGAQRAHSERGAQAAQGQRSTDRERDERASEQARRQRDRDRS